MHIVVHPVFPLHSSSEQDGFWMLAKPRMEKAASLEACIKVAKKAAQEYLNKHPTPEESG